MADLQDWGPSRATQADPGRAPVRPRLSALDVLLYLWRAKWPMLAIALPILVIGLLMAMQSPKTFTASSRLFVTGGEQTQQLPTSPDEARTVRSGYPFVLQGEVEIMRSPVVAERALSRFPLQRVFPELAQARQSDHATASAAKAEAIEAEYVQRSVEAFEKRFTVQAAANSPVVTVRFEHENADTAAELLNATIAAYLAYRADVFGDRPVDQLTVRRKSVEADLLAAEDEIRDFLQTHTIGDFASERATAQGLYSTLSAELLAVRSRASAVERQVATIRDQLAETPANVDLFVENSREQTLLDLKVEREQLLSRYTAGSRAVQNIERQIAQLEAYLAEQDAPAGLTRTGPNPTYQTLETALNTYEAEAESLAGQWRELEAQLAEIEAKLTRFNSLAPAWNERIRNRDFLEASIRALAERQQVSGTLGGTSLQGAQSVRVLEPARIPLQGSSLRLPIALMSLLVAGLLALLAGLLVAFTRTGFATPSSLRRTTGLPLLGTIARV